MTAARLGDDAVVRELATTPGFARDGVAITRMWRFADFKAAMIFVNGVAALAEKAGHHPDISIHYNEVTLRIWSHDAGGVTARDFELARRIADQARVSSVRTGAPFGDARKRQRRSARSSTST